MSPQAELHSSKPTDCNPILLIQWPPLQPPSLTGGGGVQRRSCVTKLSTQISSYLKTVLYMREDHLNDALDLCILSIGTENLTCVATHTFGASDSPLIALLSDLVQVASVCEAEILYLI